MPRLVEPAATDQREVLRIPARVVAENLVLEIEIDLLHKLVFRAGIGVIGDVSQGAVRLNCHLDRVVSTGLRAVLRVAEVNRNIVVRRIDASGLQLLVQDARESLGDGEVLARLLYRDLLRSPLNFSFPPFGRLFNHPSRDPPAGRPESGCFSLGFVPLEGGVCGLEVLSDAIAELHSRLGCTAAIGPRVFNLGRPRDFLRANGDRLSGFRRVGQDDELVAGQVVAGCSRTVHGLLQR